MQAIEKRAPSKSETTRRKILEAAVELFAACGYEGASIRDIEQRAGVNRGLVTYHFGNKEDIWKAMFDHAFGPYLDDLKSKLDMIRVLDAQTRMRLAVGNFIRASAQHPYMNQLMIQENYESSWRSDWIVEHFLIPVTHLNKELGGDDPWVVALETNPHIRYILIGACAMPFSLPSEARALYGVDVFSETFIDNHIEMVLRVIEPLFNETSQQENRNV
jgi:AcrR family transcriptional regulator